MATHAHTQPPDAHIADSDIAESTDTESWRLPRAGDTLADFAVRFQYPPQVVPDGASLDW